MCEFCTGSTKFEVNLAGTGSEAAQARSALSLDADLAQRPDAPSAANGDKAKANTASDVAQNDPKKLLADKYGVQVREVNGSHEFYFRAGGQDNVVMRTAANKESLEAAPAQLDKIVGQRVASIENTYKVKFAVPGEFATDQSLDDENCAPKVGEKVYSRQATLPLLYGIEQGLQHAQPSQLTGDGKEGVKIYLLDKQHLPDFYGGRKVQGTFRLDKDQKPAIFLTPAGQALPPSPKDTTPGERNVAWITNHEINHHSQYIHWPKFNTPDAAGQAMGWEKYTNKAGQSGFVFLKGKKGELYANGSDSCHEPSTWFAVKQPGWPIDKAGNPVATVREAAKFSNEEVMSLAQVRPSTFYFLNPVEEMAEALTSYRSGRDTRAQLFRQSPELYRLTEQYDRQELAKFYGTDGMRQAKMIRTPDGLVVPRDSVAQRSISGFDSQLRAGLR